LRLFRRTNVKGQHSLPFCFWAHFSCVTPFDGIMPAVPSNFRA
jgi:hypothetical protein